MARTPRQTVLDPVAVPDITEQATELVRAADAAELMVNDETKALATRLRYSGSLNPAALEDGIAEAKAMINHGLFTLGARLLLLKEQCGHGEFIACLERQGIELRLAQRTMKVTERFSKTGTFPLLEKLSKTALLELAVLDEEEAEDLANGMAVRGIEPDEMDTLSFKELRKRLREAKADAAAKDRLIASKNERLDTLETELGRKRAAPPKPDERLVELHEELSRQALQAVANLDAGIRAVFTQLADHHAAHGGDSSALMAGALEQIDRAARMLREDFTLTDAGDVQDFLASLQSTPGASRLVEGV
ncbi:hypothetical protein A9404_00415 [Halothiobacillus diazotrophicus]|uniref:DUF3102 domain-containing protein n=1 Tax=Halothiobacillus diazotrophicus TaxID=1860122 RepID=A0A191ZDV1_9GAMM|nr:hypothetical protein [Halothiobacillus diazotrophicus]ANJ66045.1 hypothetical protein A9404_00415 [Halothiobacillus diazotrophicus]